MIEFKPWPKTPRLNKDMVITEKIDGTNGAIIIRKDAGPMAWHIPSEAQVKIETNAGPEYFTVAAQSRNRLVFPAKDRDNQGFAAWVRERAEGLARALGEGHHYGEFYGAKIGRKYGLTGQRFALFNVGRYGPLDLSAVPGLETVPQLYQGTFDSSKIAEVYNELMENGSRAVPGWVRPEGLIVYHTASKQLYKVTDAGDLPKWQLQEIAA